jgi:hypothetical protein
MFFSRLAGAFLPEFRKPREWLAAKSLKIMGDPNGTSIAI